MFGMGMGTMGKVRGALGRFVLSQLGAAIAFAASPRKVRDGYNGPAMRVRNNANAELDIPFLANGDLDTFALMNHVGAENMITNSEQMNLGFWSRLNVSVNSNSLSAPDGTFTAGRLIESTAQDTHRVYTNTFAVTAGDILTISIYAKGTSSNRRLAIIHAYNSIPQGSGAVFNVESGTYVLTGEHALSASITPVGDGWYRCVCTCRIATTNTGDAALFNLATDNISLLQAYRGDGVSGIALWGAQLNTGPVALDYCRTTSAPTVSGQNLLLSSSDLVQGQWVGEASRANSTEPSPTASGTATLFTPAVLGNAPGVAAGSNNRVWQESIGKSVRYTIAIKVKSAGVAGAASLFLVNASSDGIVARVDVVTSAAWQTLVLTELPASNGLRFVFASAQACFIAEPQVNEGTTLLPYKATSTAILNTGSGFVTRMYDQSGNARDLTQATAANQPRIVFAGAVERVKVAENLLTYSEDFSSAAWPTQGFTVITDSIAAPDGSMTADKIVSVSGANALSRPFTATATSYSVAIYGKFGNRGVNQFMLRNNTTAAPLDSFDIGLASAVEGPKSKYIGDGWWRIVLSASSGITVGDTLAFYIGATGAVTPGDYWYLWGAQLNTGPTARTYCPTTATPVALGDAHPLNKPGYRTDGVSHIMQTGGFVVPQPFTRSSVLQFLANTGEFIGTASGANVPLFFSGTGNLVMYSGPPGALKSFKSGVGPGAVATVVEIFDADASVGSYNGVTASTAGNGPGEHRALTVGRTQGGVGNAIFSDIIIFPQALSTSDRTALEKSQRAYYGTP